MKKLVTMMLAFMLMLTGCSQSVKLEDWAELDPKGGTLTVRLPIEQGSNYSWVVNIEDETVVEQIGGAEQAGEFVASFRALADGECTIDFDYTCMDELAQSRVVRVQVKKGSVKKILHTQTTVVDGVNKSLAQPELLELRMTNKLSNVLSKHETLTYVQEAWVLGDSVAEFQGTIVSQFRNTDGMLSYQSQSTTVGGELTITDSAVEEQGVPGRYASIMPGPDIRTLTLYPQAEYRGRIEDMWLYRAPDIKETVLGVETREESGERIITSEIILEEYGVRNELKYVVDVETGLVSRVEQDVYDPVSGEHLQMYRIAVFYDEPRQMQLDAMSAAVERENACLLTLVIDPDGEEEETQRVRVGKDVFVNVLAERDFKLFRDRACTQPMEKISLRQDEETVYLRYI